MLGFDATTPATNQTERSTALVVKELATYRVDIAALRETRLTEKGQLTAVSAGYTFFWQGHPSSETQQITVSFAISNAIASNIKSLPKGISGHPVVLWLPLKHKQYVTFISTYAPPVINTGSKKKKFYSNLDKLIVSASASEKLMIMGDFNARVESK